MQCETKVLEAGHEPARELLTRLEPLAILPHKPLPPSLVSQIEQKRCPGYYGPVDTDQLVSQATTAICSNSDADAGLLGQVMREFISTAREDCIAEAPSRGVSSEDAVHSCWLCIRMTLPTDDWVVPRWHQDGRMFQCSCPEPRLPHAKYAFTIMGPSTRAMLPSSDVAAVLGMRSKTGRRWNQNEPDPEFAERMAEYPEAVVRLGQIIRFSWGNQDSPVHSEPDSTGQHRIFLSILFGSEDELRNMCEFRDETYGAWY